MHPPHPDRTRAAGPHRHQRAGRGPRPQDRELARYKLGRLTADDADGYHRVACPAVTGKIRCPLRPASMTLDRGRPEILHPPEHPQACCAQQTITVPPDVIAKTAQKHDYPSAAWRRSYARRTGAERGFATAKDPATNDIARGWCRLMGLTPLMLFTTTLLIVRNQRILGRLERPAGRKPAPRRRRAPPENPQTAPQDPRRARRRGRPSQRRICDHDHARRRTRDHQPGQPQQQAREHALTHGQTSRPDTRRAPEDPGSRNHGNQHAGMSDPNVKIGPH